MYLIYRYLLRSTVGPFFFGLFVITFLLMIEILYKYVDLFVSKGVPFLLATKVLGLSLGHTFALSVPMAVLVAILMAVGQLAADHEITAFKASGISLWSILRPLLGAATVVAIGLTAYNHWVFPESNHTLANLVYDINRKKPMLEIQPRRFNELNDRMTIRVSAKDDLTGRIEDVQIIEREKPNDVAPRLTVATWGRIIPDHETDSMLIELHDGEVHERPDKEAPDKYQVIRFKQQNVYVNNVERDFRESGRKARGDREMNLTSLWAAAAEERGKQLESRKHVASQAHNLLSWHWQLLDPDRRGDVLGTRAVPPAGTPQRRSVVEPRFRATRLKVERTVEQSEYQGKIAASYEVRRNKYMVEFHKKFAIPFACVVFALLGVPMAVTTSRSGKGVSVSLAIAVFAVYYLFLVGGEKFADRGLLNPMLAMWSANIVLTAVGIPVFLKTVRESTLLSITLKPGAVPPPAGESADPDGAAA
ncbi:MAG: YjgP/YjgQ family permease [bacterium]|nr:YjgP/YjgQ family permease [bacterium]